MSDRIFAPNLYLCAYHLKKDGTQGDSHPLWENCDRILSHLTDARLIPHLDINTKNRILLKNNTEISFGITDHPDIEGFIQPVQLQDSYGVFLNVGYDDSNPANTVEIPVLQELNPHQIFPFPKSEYLLGQTLLLTLALTPENQDLQGSDLTDLANQCYQALLNKDTSPSRSQELFGSPIFEYGKPHQTDESPHVLIWLFRDEVADQILGKCFQPTFDLFFYRHKVGKAFQDSREIYRQLKQYYLGLDSILDEIQIQIDAANPDPQNPTYLQSFKTQLKQLSSDSLTYDRLLRKIKDFSTTIDINCNNYNDKVDEICARLGIDKEELSLWWHFGEQTAPQFRRQIAADLSYFEQGTGLMSQAIASIRAIVEIDQAQCDRTWQRWEKKRDKKFQEELHQKDQAFQTALERQRDNANRAKEELQDNIQAIGLGVGVGAILASSAGVITQPWYWPNQVKITSSIPLPHPFLISVAGSGAIALLTWYCTKRKLDRRRQQRDRS